jgi:translation initiation factor IF-1
MIADQVKLRPAMSDASIHTHGRILEQAGPALYRVSLPNGKIILAHLSKRLADANAGFEVDRQVLLELTPYDFDTARILGGAEAQRLLADAEAAEDNT